MRNWTTVGLAWLALGLCWGVLAGDQFTFDPNLRPQFRAVVEPVNNPPAAPVDEKPFFVFFTAGPLCGPCVRWETNEQPKVLKAGYGVEKVNIGNPGIWQGWVDYYHIERGPMFFIVDRKTNLALTMPPKGDTPPEPITWLGFTSAITLIQAAEGKRVLAPADHSVKTARLTCPEIKALVRSLYSPGQELMNDVKPRSNVWNHLTDGSGGTHTFTHDQVSCLSLWEALALHDDAHEARVIKPY